MSGPVLTPPFSLDRSVLAKGVLFSRSNIWECAEKEAGSKRGVFPQPSVIPFSPLHPCPVGAPPVPSGRERRGAIRSGGRRRGTKQAFVQACRREPRREVAGRRPAVTSARGGEGRGCEVQVAETPARFPGSVPRAVDCASLVET